jgi:hypothetical protein
MLTFAQLLNLAQVINNLLKYLVKVNIHSGQKDFMYIFVIQYPVSKKKFYENLR